MWSIPCAAVRKWIAGVFGLGLLVGTGKVHGAAQADSLAFLPIAVSAQDRPADAKRQGALFRVSRAGKFAYLFGTVHVGNKSFYPLAPEVQRAFADAEQLVLELDTRADDAFQRALRAHAVYAAGEQIGQHVSPATLARLIAALRRTGLELQQVAHLKPWLLANLLAGMELHRSGYERSHGLEAFLLEQAMTRGTAIAELESADYQLSLFASLNEREAERYLEETLAGLADGSSLRRSRALIDAWASGDVAALDAVLPDATAGNTVMSDFTRRILLDKRNPEMAERIERILAEGKTAFVGVGLLHVLGANGLPQLLAQRGYRVERMY